MFEQTNADGIMIGRASIGNPWIFREIIEYLSGIEITQVTKEEKLQTILQHIDLQVKYLGEGTGIKEMRKYMTYYLKGLPNACQIRQEVNQIETQKELENCIVKYFS